MTALLILAVLLGVPAAAWARRCWLELEWHAEHPPAPPVLLTPAEQDAFEEIARDLREGAR